MHTSLPRASAVIAAAVAVSASALIGSAQPAFAYNSCSKTYASDPYQQTWVSVTCPAPQPGVPNSALFRAVTYSCAYPGGSGCSATPIYGNWAALNSTSTAHASGYVDLNRVTVQYQLPF